MFNLKELITLSNIIEEYLNNYTENEQRECIEFFQPTYILQQKINNLIKNY